MEHFAVNWLAIILAAVASMAIGFGWYTVLAKQWMAAQGKPSETFNTQDFTPYIWSVLVQLVIAYFLARLTPWLFGETNVGNGILCAVHMWLGFVITSMILNHRYQGAKWSLTLIDGGYLLVFMVAQGIVIGLFGGGAAPVAVV